VYFAALNRSEVHQFHVRIASGIAVSMALHILLLSVWRSDTVRVPTEPEPGRTLAVRIRPPPVSEPAPLAAPPAATRTPAPRTSTRSRKPHAVEVVPPHRRAPAGQLAVPGAPDLPTAPAPAEPRGTPRFDMDAARRLARRIADDPDPARANTAAGQFPDPSYRPETRAARVIAAAKRRDCKDGIPGGLLAPLYLMLDKKDSGCKW
jgi:hypothetical protein